MGTDGADDENVDFLRAADSYTRRHSTLGRLARRIEPSMEDSGYGRGDGGGLGNIGRSGGSNRRTRNPDGVHTETRATRAHPARRIGRVDALYSRATNGDRLPPLVPYGEQIPQAQSMYDWAPSAERGESDDEGEDNGNEGGNDDDDDDDGDDPGERPPSYAQVRWHAMARNLHREAERTWRRQQQQGLEGDHGDAQEPLLHDSAGFGDEPFGRDALENTDSSSLATAALLQSVRRHPRFSARTRDALQDFILNRESRRTDRSSGPDPTTSNQTDSDREADPGNQPWQNSDFEERVHAYARVHMGSQNPPWQGRMQQAFSYLDQTRDCIQEADIQAAINTHSLSYLSGDLDFIRQPDKLSSPPPSSWLRPGTTFSGSQHAANSSVAIHSLLRRARAQDAARNNEFSHAGISLPAGSAPPRAEIRDMLNDTPIRKHDHWPVQVTIHSVDYENMTLTGTMEAQNIPDKSQTANIVTYLEGEIIDFNKHTLATHNFESTIEKDCEYWRMLAPFKGMNEHDCVGKLLSRIWVEEVLLSGWILMRWKGKKLKRPNYRISFD